MQALTTPTKPVDALCLMETLGQRIREARAEKRWTQKRLADTAGFDAQSVSNYERDVHEPNLQRLEAIARALGKPMSHFVDEPAAQQELRDEIAQIKSLLEDLLERLPPAAGSQ